MESFSGILYDVIHKRRLPLPSIIRREAAIETIKNASGEIMAVCMWEQDPWLREDEDRDYWNANIDAAERGCQIKRVIVTSNSNETDDARSFFEPRKLQNMEFCYADEDSLKRRITGALSKGRIYQVTFRNILICRHRDQDIMTRSTPNDPTHDGELTLDSNEIISERTLFNLAWKNAEP
jgi:hypothetical protein